MHLLFGFDNEVARVVGEGLGVVIHPPFVAIGVVDDRNRLMGGMVFNNYTKASVEITVYGPRCMKRGVIRAAMHYAFIQLGVLNLRARTKRSNARMRKILPKLGYRFEATLDQYYGPSRANDALLFRIARPQADKWLKGKM